MTLVMSSWGQVLNVQTKCGAKRSRGPKVSLGDMYDLLGKLELDSTLSGVLTCSVNCARLCGLTLLNRLLLGLVQASPLLHQHQVSYQ